MPQRGRRRRPGDAPVSRRRGGAREQRKRYLIVIGGEQTERLYFKWIKEQVGRQAVIDIEARVLDPRQLVDRAERRAREDSEEARRSGDSENTYDAVWVVTDVDEWAGQIAELRRRGTGDVDLVVSNPCFEVWLVLHTDTAPQASGRDVQAQARSLGVVEGRDGKVPVLTMLEGKTADAARRAQNLRQRHTGDGTTFPHDAPSSDVDQIVRALRLIDLG